MFLVYIIIGADLEDTEHYAGGTISLHCNATGSPIMWYKDDYPVITDARVSLSVDNATLTIVSLELSDNAEYSCEAANDSDIAYLTILCELTIGHMHLNFIGTMNI